MIHDLPKSLLEDSKKILEGSKEYQEFFKKALKKFGVSSPAEFKSDEEKKKFFDYVDKNYKGKNESVTVKEYVEQLTEGKKGKYKSKKSSKITSEINKVLKREKKEGYDDVVKQINEFLKMFKSGIETEEYEEMEILTAKSLKQLDKIFSNMESQPRDEIAAILDKHDPDLYDMIFGF